MTSLFSSGWPAALNASATSRGPTEPNSLPSGLALALTVTLAPSVRPLRASAANRIVSALASYSAALLELGDIGRVGVDCLALRHEVVAAVARLDMTLSPRPPSFYFLQV
jgi:hypothetical protein